MSIADAMNPQNLLCHEMNGSPALHGFLLRLVVPGWYGVASVKWLSRIELRNARFTGRFMGRDYVTVHEDERNGKKIVTETSVGHALLKSAPARIVRRDGRYVVLGAAWGPRAIAATWTLGCGAVVFLLALNGLWEPADKAPG